MKRCVLFACAVATILATVPGTPAAFAEAGPSKVEVAAPAAAKVYALAEDPKFTNIAFESRMDIEDILGTSRVARGTVELIGDVAKFDIKVPVESLKTGIDLRDEHLRNDMWLAAAKFPEISFRGTANGVKTDGKFAVAGEFTMRGKAQKTTVALETKAIPQALATKLGLAAGDWVRVRATFAVKLSAHGIKVPAPAAAKVSDVWNVSVSVFAKASK